MRCCNIEDILEYPTNETSVSPVDTKKEEWPGNVSLEEETNSENWC